MIQFSRRAALLGFTGAAALPLLGCQGAPSTQAFSRVQALLDQYADARKTSGVSVALKARGGDVAFLNAGTLALDTDARAGADSLYRIYSMTKPITALAALLCVEDGRLGLDQPIADFVPEFAAMRVVTGAGAQTRAAQTQITRVIR